MKESDTPTERIYWLVIIPLSLRNAGGMRERVEDGEGVFSTFSTFFIFLVLEKSI